MTVWTGLSRGARAAIVTGGAAVAAVVVGLLWPGRSPEQPVPAPAPAVVATVPDAAKALGTGTEVAAAPTMPQPVTEPAAPFVADLAQAPDADPVTQPDASPLPPESVLPSFDGYRVEADGSAVVSGRTEPMAVVTVLVDGRVVATASAGGDGSFAALFTLAPTDQPSLMTLEALRADGRKLASAQSVALGPIVGPVVAAAPATLAASEPESTESLSPAPSAPAPDAPAPVALLVTDEGATVAQPPVLAEIALAETALAETALALAQTVQLEAISYSPLGAVQLSGTGQAGQTVRIYLDNAAVADARIDSTGLWQVTLGDTAPGIYTLRVDQIDAVGKVIARFETPFKRETQDALAALATPQADLGQVPPAPDGQAGAAEPTVAVATQPPAQDPLSVTDASAVALPAAADPSASGDAATLPDAALAPGTVQADAAPAAQAPPPPVSITVQPGFTLWGIARDSFGDGVMYVQVYNANRDKIRDPDLIYPGQVFTIPAKP